MQEVAKACATSSLLFWPAGWVFVSFASLFQLLPSCSASVLLCFLPVPFFLLPVRLIPIKQLLLLV